MRLTSAWNAIAHPASETINHIIDRIGWTSIAATVSITAGKQAQVIETTGSWDLANTALLVSLIGGGLFVVVKLQEIYINRLTIREKKAAIQNGGGDFKER